MAEPGEPGPQVEEEEGERDPMDPESWYATPNVCGSCIAWRPENAKQGETVASGSCRLRPELPRVPATLKLCSLYKGRGQFVYQPGKEPVKRRKRASPVTVMRRGADDELVTLTVRASRRPEPRDDDDAPAEARRTTPLARPRELITSIDVGTDSPPLLKQVLVDVIREELGKSGREIIVRFKGGKIEMKRSDGKSVTFPVERLFVMLDKLRTSLDELEDAFSRSDPLLDQMPEVQKQIAAIQGSFTTFNFLFSDRADYFGA